MMVLPWQEEEVIKLFGGSGGGAGSVTAVRVVRDAKTGKGRGIAFVEFAGRGDARMALALDSRPLRGRALRVTRVARTGAAGDDAQEGLGSRLRTPFSRGALLMHVILIWHRMMKVALSMLVGTHACRFWHSTESRGPGEKLCSMRRREGWASARGRGEKGQDGSCRRSGLAGHAHKGREQGGEGLGCQNRRCGWC
jgi:hypothetical protein